MSKILDSARFSVVLLSLVAIVLFVGCPPPPKPTPPAQPEEETTEKEKIET